MANCLGQSECPEVKATYSVEMGSVSAHSLRLVDALSKQPLGTWHDAAPWMPTSKVVVTEARARVVNKSEI